MDMNLDCLLEEDKRILIMVGRMSFCNEDEDFFFDSYLDDLNVLRFFDFVFDDIEIILMLNFDNIEFEKLSLSEKLLLDEEMEVVKFDELDMLLLVISLLEVCLLLFFFVVS